uniref:Uncharacterized protein n=1 Tax=Stomoxys calcitrans TaxID=35570 RepID=A0A1I8Q2F3_STOCA
MDESITKPLNLANSAVLRAVEEEEQEMKSAIEMFTTCPARSEKASTERKSRSRQRFEERPHTPLHHQQLEQIKTQYLNHQHDITIDRDTVLKINRLATRRNLHKREHSWPPETMIVTPPDTEAGKRLNGQTQSKNSGDTWTNRLHEHHVRSTSTDNALQFDESVCRRHGIDAIREKFNSPTRIIEPTAKEVRIQRQRRQHQQEPQIRYPLENYLSNQSSKTTDELFKLPQEDKRTEQKNLPKKSAKTFNSNDASKTDEKELVNGYVQEENNTNLSSKIKVAWQHPSISDSNIINDSKVKTKESPLSPYKDLTKQPTDGQQVQEQHQDESEEEDEAYQATSLPKSKGFSHPETKAADEDIGLVEPKRQFFEQLTSCKKWFSYENLNAASQCDKSTKTKPLQPPSGKHYHPKRQSFSLERGRDSKYTTRRQLPPQKPRNAVTDIGEQKSPKLQRRSIKMATEIKICYDADAEEHEIQVKSLNHPRKAMMDDLEKMPLPQPPHVPPSTNRSQIKDTELIHQIPISLESQQDGSEQLLSKSPKNSQMYDDACIYLRSIDLQDNTVAYIPAALTIVPSPSEEAMHHWLETGGQLKANILQNEVGSESQKVKTTKNNKIKKDTSATAESEAVNHLKSNENLMSSFKPESMKSTPEVIKQPQQQANGNKASGPVPEPETYVTRLPSTPNGIQLTRQTSVNTKRKSQLNNSSSGKDSIKVNSGITEPKAAGDGDGDCAGASAVSTTVPPSPTILLPSAPLTTPQGVIHTYASAPGSDDGTVTKTTHPAMGQSNNCNNSADSSTGSSQTNKPHESDKTQRGIYYTDGEYLYGPYDPTNGMPLSRITIQAIQASNSQQQQKPQPTTDQTLPSSMNPPPPPSICQHPSESGIKKDIEAETIEKNQHKNEIASLTAKYEHIQKSITEHLRQIDAYIENAKTALKCSLREGREGGGNIITPPQQPDKAESHDNGKLEENHNSQSCETTTPLQEILRKISHIMQDVEQQQQQPQSNQAHHSATQSKSTLTTTTLSHNKEATVTAKPPASTQSASNDQENTAIVDKVLMDLNKLTTHLKEYEQADITANHKSLQPLIDNLRQMQPLELTFETRPTAQRASYVTVSEDNVRVKERERKVKKDAKKQEKQTGEPQPLSARNSCQTQSPELMPHRPPNHLQQRQKLKNMTNVVANYELLGATGNQVINSSQEKQAPDMLVEGKNLVSDFIAARHQQQQLIGQVIDTLGKCCTTQNETKGKEQKYPQAKVSPNDKHGAVTADATSTAEVTKSNLNQTTSSFSGHNKKIVSHGPVPSPSMLMSSVGQSKDADHHDAQKQEPIGPSLQSRRGKRNESQLKLVIKNSRGIMADKQFPKYDKQLMNSKVQHHRSPAANRAQHQGDKKPTVIDKNAKQPHDQQAKEIAAGDTYKSSYEVRSPYVTERQISWGDMQVSSSMAVGQGTKNTSIEGGDIAETTRKSMDEKKHTGIGELQILANVPTHSPSGKSSGAVTASTTRTTSGLVEMQSTVPSKPRIQTRQQNQQQHLHQDTLETAQLETDREVSMHTGRYPAPLIEPHIPKRAASPFGLNAVDTVISCRQGTPSPPITKKQEVRCPTPPLPPPPPPPPLSTEAHDNDSIQTIRKYPKALVEPHVATTRRSVSPFATTPSKQRSVSISPTRRAVNSKKSKSPPTRASPGRNNETSEPLRKYPAPLVEPLPPTRSNSPFGLNSVVVPSPPPPPPPPPPPFEDFNTSDKISPIRKYPPAFIEPHVPRRSASPFGLNVVEVTLSHSSKGRARTPSPARAMNRTNNSACHNKPTAMAYVPQVEGHNVGLLVRTAAVLPPAVVNHAIVIDSLAKNQTTLKAEDNIPANGGARECTALPIPHAETDQQFVNEVDDYDDDDEDELQRFNTRNSAPVKKITNTQHDDTTKTGSNSAAYTTDTMMMTSNLLAPTSVQGNQLFHEQHDHCLMTAESSMPPSTSVINRSFDNVSPRPYISIELMTAESSMPPSTSVINRSFDNVSPRPYISIE